MTNRFSGRGCGSPEGGIVDVSQKCEALTEFLGTLAHGKEVSADEVMAKELLIWEVQGLWETEKSIPLLDALVETKLAVSKRDARELIIGKAIRVNGSVVTDVKFLLAERGSIVQRGKGYDFAMIVVSQEEAPANEPS